MAQETFEGAYARLEQILAKMNEGTIPLEETVRLYEEADALIAWCNEQLRTAERKIEVLIKNREGDVTFTEQGTPQTQAFVPHAMS